MKRGPYRLEPDAISHDTVEALEELTEKAKTGEVIGIAFAVMYKGKRYVVNTAGEAHRSPTFSLGMVDMLADHLRAQEKGAA